MTEMISIMGRLKYPLNQEAPLSNDVHKTMIQVRSDALFGTYANFPSFWDDKFEKPIDSFANYILEREDERHYSFELLLNEDFFKISSAGLQHLVGVLAGDLFQSVKSVVNVYDVKLTEKMKADAKALFRENKAYSISETRKAFSLKDDEPLLAYTFKPRNGLKLDKLEEITLGVLKAGFHIVELDTRNLNIEPTHLDFLIELSKKAAGLGKNHVTRFSPNLSVPSHLVVPLATRFLEAQPDPVVIKIDGGLDGISALQAVRSIFSKNKGNGRSPIITCYPLLRRQLAEKTSENLFVDTLSLSGADIIYIGSRPSFPSSARELDAKGSELKSSVLRYRNYIDADQSMPTLAGGLPAAQLHAFYDLLGPKVSYFLGGAIALHKKGPMKGAALCVKVINRAIEIRKKYGNKLKFEKFDDKLLGEIENAYDTKFAYYNPADLYLQYKELNLFI